MSDAQSASQIRDMVVSTCAIQARHALRINRLMQHNANVAQQRNDWSDRQRMVAIRAERTAKLDAQMTRKD